MHLVGLLIYTFIALSVGHIHNVAHVPECFESIM